MSKIQFAIIAAIIVVLGYLLIHYQRFPEHQAVDVETVRVINESDSPLDFHKWREFFAPTGHFRVLMPVIPQHATDKFIDPKTKEPRKYETYVAVDSSGLAFMISTITFPSKIDDSLVDEAMQNIVTDMLNRNKDNKLKNMKLGEFRNYKALDFSVENGELLLVGKIIAGGDTLYVASVLSKNNLFNEQALNFFINSLTIQELSNKTPPIPQTKTK